MINVSIDDEGWVRWPEVERFADNRGITLSEAIEILVNSGLSHL